MILAVQSRCTLYSSKSLVQREDVDMLNQVWVSRKGFCRGLQVHVHMHVHALSILLSGTIGFVYKDARGRREECVIIKMDKNYLMKH